ncbi:mevalonate kinase [Microbacterium sp. BG28]|uniref:mevalonate kinase n=1 Tax=Microbacterium sp. BG28 TaxID=3097356 RepID=UPI002A59F8D5|nr:mevalonate kinase [Microbacterium sp. BG28]MDY0829316.1 mevalonate kinase [Microbacterium sp. BG28]
MTSSSARPVRPSDAPATPTPTAAASGRASGKAILLGEHAVVYRRPALAIPLSALQVQADVRRSSGPSLLHSDLYDGPLAAAPARLGPTVMAATAALDAVGAADESIELRIASNLPAERGVGSSAAVAAAVVRAVAAAFGVVLDAAVEHELIQRAERVAHVSPSGLDAHAVSAGAPIWFEDGAVSPVAVAAPLTFVIADTGISGRTREAVAGVRTRHDEDPQGTTDLLDELGELTRDARTHLATGDARSLGAVMDRGHTALDRLGVGDPALDALAAAARAHGAWGAKLTGGGRGGCVLVLARGDESAAEVAGALRGAGAAATWTTTVEATT